ncbi:hypothetical protein STEG23_004820, partial [Scotinomys teguina]
PVLSTWFVPGSNWGTKARSIHSASPTWRKEASESINNERLTIYTTTCKAFGLGDICLEFHVEDRISRYPRCNKKGTSVSAQPRQGTKDKPKCGSNKVQLDKLMAFGAYSQSTGEGTLAGD